MAMKNDLIFLALALITGALIPIQAATNAAFSKSIGTSLMTGLMVFIVGLVGMLFLFYFHEHLFLHDNN